MSKFLRSLVRSAEKSCTGKVKYPREDSAQRNALAMAAKKGNGEVFEYYKCDFCDGWHLGHQTNFDWIPSSHRAQWLMVNKFQCLRCAVSNETGMFYTNTVFASRILDHFPNVKNEPELLAQCPKCKTKEWNRPGEFFNAQGRRWINLEHIDPDSEETLESLYENTDVSS